MTFKAMKHKSHGDLQLVPVPTHQWKDLSIDFVTGLLVSTNQKSETYNSIFVLINRLIKIVHYKLVKATSNVLSLVKVIINIVMQYHGLSDSIVSDQSSAFMSKIWSLLCYFLGIKQKLSTAFHPQTDGQTKNQNNTIKTYLQAFVNYEENNWTRLFPIA